MPPYDEYKWDFRWGGRSSGKRKSVIDQIIDEFKQENKFGFSLSGKPNTRKIKIAPGQPINTGIFEEAEVIEFIPNKNKEHASMR